MIIWFNPVTSTEQLELCRVVLCARLWSIVVVAGETGSG